MLKQLPRHCREKPMVRNRVWLMAPLLAAVLASGCATVKSYWPFGRGAVAAPVPVTYLEVRQSGVRAVSVLQFWERNTLVVDMQNVDTSGDFSLVRHEGQEWPVRIAFRMSTTRVLRSQNCST